MPLVHGTPALSSPETPLLAVLPGTGCLTRLVDKRKVRRDRADVFCTTAEGIKGKRAKEWGLVDQIVSRSAWDKTVAERAAALAARQTIARGPAFALPPLEPKITDRAVSYSHVELAIDRAARTANLLVRGPAAEVGTDPAKLAAAGTEPWSLRAFRELDDALLRLRFDLPEIGLVTIRTAGAPGLVQAADEALA